MESLVLKNFFIIRERAATVEEMAIEYKNLLETISAKQNLVVCQNRIFSKQEPTVNIRDPETLEIVSFENNPLYDKYHFINNYPVSPETFEAFKKTGNIDISKKEKKAKINIFQRKQAQVKRKKTTVQK